MRLRSLCVIGTICILYASSSTATAQFQMEGLDLLAHVPLNAMGGSGSAGNDIWGWTDPQTGNEYALFGRTNGTSFVDITNPTSPIYVGNLPTSTGSSTWRDIKVYEDHAFIVSDSNGPHGMQVFDLTRLRGVNNPQNFTADTTWDRFGFRSAHNIAINEDTGFAYIVGSDDAGGGLVMVDISNPTSPSFAGQFAADGYTHDLQVVTYTGPDSTYGGREIAFNSNEDTLTIVDVTNKSNPVQLGRQSYNGVGYAHQGWLTEDQRYFLMNDEFDEFFSPNGRPRTHIWDVQDLDNPVRIGFHEGTVASSDHNLYIKGDLVYQANYQSGLRVLEMTDLANSDLTEIAWIDTSSDTGVGFDGAWSVFPYFDSGSIIVSDQDEGLFVVRLESFLPDGDFNDDGVFDCADVNSLTAMIAAGTNDSDFDLDGNGDVDGDDLTEWLAQAGAAELPSGNPYLPADANLDGVVDGVDFNSWNTFKFAPGDAFCNGDFNADGTIDGLDFLIWNEHRFMSSGDAVVPEPSFAIWQLMCFIGGLGGRHWRGRKTS